MIQLIQPDSLSRQYHLDRQVALSDTDSTGRLRLDACARYLQDVAAFDAINADISHLGNWVLKQNAFEISMFPTYGSKLRTKTYLSGSGRAWIERSSVIFSEESGDVFVRAKAIWVLTNSTTGTPITVPAEIYDIYGPLATHHKISARDGKRPELPENIWTLDWQFRITDQDILAHLNNASYLEPVEEILHINKIILQRDKPIMCQITYRESTSCDDPTQLYYSITNNEESLNISVYFADTDQIRTNISIMIPN